MNLRGQALLDFVNAQPREKSRSDIAAELGYTYKKLDNELHRAKRLAGTVHKTKPAPDLFEFDAMGTPWTLTGDWVIVGDVHVPFTDYDFAQLPALVGKKLKINRLIVAGDFYNFDLMSAYAHLVEPPSWKTEKKAARHMADVWLESFKEIRFLMGNHDRRITKSTGFMDEDDLHDLLGRPERCQWSKYGWCVVKSDNGDWRVTHPRNYSINPLIVADTLAQKFDSHIISFHEHHSSISLDRYGRHIIVNGGCMVDDKKLAYVSLDDSKSAAMKKAFVVLKDGYPYLMAEGITDWSKTI
jgi:Icc-related predicted phosphoesterase